MTDFPPVPEEPKGSSSPVSKPLIIGATSSDYDAVETGALDPNQKKVDDAKLKAVEFEHEAKVQAFYFTLVVSASMFAAGAFMFYHASHRMFGWQTILILFAFFTPATIILSFLIRAIYVSATNKPEDKKDDLSELVPVSAATKIAVEVVKTISK